MNWGKVKTILIIFFLFVDVFLALNVFPGNKKEPTQDTINQTVEVLASRGISVSRDIVVQKRREYKTIEADNAIEDYEKFARTRLGDDINAVNGTSFSGNGGKVRFNGELFTFEAAETVQGDAVGTASDAQNIAKKYLVDLLPDLNKADVSSSIIPDGYRIVFTNKLGGMPLFNSQVTVDVCMGSVKKISGSWFYKTESSGNENNLKSITSALIECISMFETGKGTEITSIDLGYTLFEENTYHKSAVLIPVWQICTANGQEIHIDARSSE